MDRRLLTVMGVSLLFALIVTAALYRLMPGGSASATKPKRTQMRDLVIAARALPVGAVIKPDDIKVIQVPAEQFPKDGFSRVEEVIDHPVISNILPEEPIRKGRLGARGSGVGLAPLIPEGMRAVTIRVDEVVGVAGFVMPGMRVDVLVTGRPPGSETVVTRTVLQNIQVLSAGQHTEPDASGKPITARTVTLLVRPEEAEAVTLAANEGKVQLVLRNSTDATIAQTEGRALEQLYGRHARTTPQESEVRAAARPSPQPVAVEPQPPPPPPVHAVVVWRGAQKTVEQVELSHAGWRGNR